MTTKKTLIKSNPVKRGGTTPNAWKTWVEMKTIDSKALPGHKAQICNGTYTGMCRDSNDRSYDCPDLRNKKVGGKKK